MAVAFGNQGSLVQDMCIAPNQLRHALAGKNKLYIYMLYIIRTCVHIYIYTLNVSFQHDDAIFRVTTHVDNDFTSKKKLQPIHLIPMFPLPPLFFRLGSSMEWTWTMHKWV